MTDYTYSFSVRFSQISLTEMADIVPDARGLTFHEDSEISFRFNRRLTAEEHESLSEFAKGQLEGKEVLSETSEADAIDERSIKIARIITRWDLKEEM